MRFGHEVIDPGKIERDEDDRPHSTRFVEYGLAAMHRGLARDTPRPILAHGKGTGVESSPHTALIGGMGQGRTRTGTAEEGVIRRIGAKTGNGGIARQQGGTQHGVCRGCAPADVRRVRQACRESVYVLDRGRPTAGGKPDQALPFRCGIHHQP
ncbi:MAG: hypothetical protein M3361_12790 [Candidatus Tectomicrobia bacterium]|nr:hypothetical protein [Candidatus Tectomicrobia bacterium]